ncbi:cenp-O kinetochore centromere component [Colletotrichum tofieldiae]|uniref:Cenp-O kinetochore centromere component n=1 Tax=Colletotrichum tofieldiae TaxID=708197 RepID=A0A166MJM7_9PEZI|nr:cenp-O kinetochore centromere component [Colletotrichum tofieldiae]GKT62347.1 cenp-O kinetochore centromere component [Colletotrichum tofieldiae]GKT69606.1 cenp-O kinetochore centromere component [Colletotrichum tofieldiae]GKT92572.1 cenp-O kinetochore centromere component [Colletotrichum tofieldiae]
MSAESQDAVAETLNQEINDLRAKVASLKKELKVQATALISSESTRTALQVDKQKRSAPALPAESNPARDQVLSRSKAQDAHDQQCLYRTCATVTTFKVQDPDPNAVDRGHVLGIRIEIMSDAKFRRPYYVMLNRPYKESRNLRVHRHTIPPCIPLSALAARHLPAPKPADDEGQKTQDLSRFVRTLRREIVRFHNRTAVIGDLQKAAGLRGSGDADEDPEQAVTSITAADIEAKQISIEWADGRAGRLVMSEDGQIQKLVVLGSAGRDREVTRDLLGDSRRVEDVAQQLAST